MCGTPPSKIKNFGDTDGEFFDRKNFRPKKNSAENVFGRKFFGRKVFRPKNFSAENFAVRIAEGGSNGGGPGGRRPPPVRPSVRTSVLGLPVRGSGNWFGSEEEAAIEQWRLMIAAAGRLNIKEIMEVAAPSSSPSSSASRSFQMRGSDTSGPSG